MESPTQEELAGGTPEQPVENGTPETPAEQLDGGNEPSESTDDSNPAVETEPVTAETFTNVDPKTLPPELQSIYKSMQADFTRKTQDIASSKEKAEAFDTLASNPQFSKLMEVLGGQAAPQATEISQLSGEQLLEKIIEDPNYLQDLIKQEARKQVEPLELKYFQDVAAKELVQLDQKYSVEKYGDTSFRALQPKIAELVDKGYGAEEAYKIITWDSAKQKGANEATATLTKRNKDAQPSSKAADVVSAAKSFNSVREAFNDAATQHGYPLN